MLGDNKTFLIFVLLFVVFVPLHLHAASLLFTPPKGECSVNATCAVSISVSAQETINAVSGTVSFPTPLMEVESISRSNSIFDLWAKNPSFSNSKGTISFEGVILNPGFIGKGTILTVTFRPKDVGVINLSFTAGQVLANDGLATNVIASKGSATITVTEEVFVSPQLDLSTTTEEVIDLVEETKEVYDMLSVRNLLIVIVFLCVCIIILLGMLLHKKSVSRESDDIYQ